MEGGGARTARLGGHIHEDQIGDERSPIGEVRKVQDRLPASGLPSGPPTPPAVAVVLVERDDSSEIDGGSAVAAFATGFEGLLSARKHAPWDQWNLPLASRCRASPNSGSLFPHPRQRPIPLIHIKR